MTIHIQALYDVLVGIITTVGVAAVVSIALVAAGAVHERGQRRNAQASRPDAAPGQYPAQTDPAGELQLR